MFRARARSHDGFTLIELLITITIMGLIAGALFSAIYVGFEDTAGVADRLSGSHDLQQATAFFTTDAQSADRVYDGASISAPVAGSTNWTLQTAPDLRDVSFPADTISGWAVGLGGRILDTADGGVTWNEETSGVTNDLNGLAFATDGLHGWAVGAGGTIIATTDGGSTWTTQTSGVTKDLYDVYFNGTNLGVAVGQGGTILGTKNGGSTWVARTSGTTADLYGFSTYDGTHGLVVGTNAGTANAITEWSGNLSDPTTASWAVQTAKPPTSNTLRSVYLKDNSNGYAVGLSGTIVYCSANCTAASPTWGGPVTSPTGTLDLYSIRGVSATTMWAVGKSDSSGNTSIEYCTGGSNCRLASNWTSSGTGLTTGDLYGFYPFDSTHGWAVGSSGTVLLYTANRWSDQSSQSQDLFSVAALTTTSVWSVGGGGTILWSGGTGTWASETSGTTNQLNTVYARDATHLYAAGAGGTVLFCTTSCATPASAVWASMTSNTTSNLTDIAAQGAGAAWIVGATGVGACSSNCDKATGSFSSVVSTVALNLKGLAFGDATHVWAVGTAGTIVYCSASCNNTASVWAVTVSGVTSDVNAIVSFDKNNAWAVTADGKVLYTSNGTTWAATPVASNALNSIAIVKGASAATSTLYAVGSGGVAYLSTDGGTTWNPDPTGTNGDLYGVSAASTTLQWAVGAGGTTLGTSTPSPVWTQSTDDSLNAVPAPTCPDDTTHGAVPLDTKPLISFQWSDPPGAATSLDYAASYYLVGTQGTASRQLIRESCTRDQTRTDPLDSDPYVYQSQATIAHTLPSGDPTLTCYIGAAVESPCDSAATLITLSFPAINITGQSSPAFTVEAKPRQT